MKKINISPPITVKELASKLSVEANELIAKMMDLGEKVTINTALDDKDTIEIIAHEFNYDVTFKKIKEAKKEIKKESKKKTEKKKKTIKAKHRKVMERAPIVTFMGHVDHGKTSLLDLIRKSKITEKESGGITQHIGAYVVNTEKGRIVFLDTPGHEAFTKMRARGANITDIVVLVIAADDGIMPQTIEAIDHCMAAGVPIIVAINKIDLASANPDKVKKQLSEKGLSPEGWGGEIITCEVSAKNEEGLDHLLEMILLQAEMMELEANPKKKLKAYVIESKLSKGKGPTATIVIKDGTLRIGDIVLSGLSCGRLKSMMDEHGSILKEAGPSTPVEIFGLSEVPEAGAELSVEEKEKKAREIVEDLKLKSLETAETPSTVTLEDIYSKIAEGNIKELNLIIKADTMGSIEAITGSIESMHSDEVRIKIIHTGTGDVSENDIMLASASKAIIIGFHVKANQKVREIEKKEGVDIRIYNVIYDLIDEVEKSIEGLLEPKIKEVIKGHARVKQVFKISKIGNIAGCIVENGTISNKDKVKVIRDEEEIFKGNIAALKRFKDEAKEVRKGQECGIQIASFDKLEDEDIIEAFELKLEKAK